MTATLNVRRAGGLTVLTLERPDKGNALSPALVAELDAALQHAEGDGTQLLVLVGSGKNFCTGLDLSDLKSETDDTLLARFVRVELLLQRLHGAPFATLAIARGRTIGAGADLFAACEQRWVLEDASFAFPDAGFGLVLGTARLAAIVGPARARARAREWIGSGRSVPVDEAVQTGLASERVRAADAEEKQSDRRQLSWPPCCLT